MAKVSRTVIRHVERRTYLTGRFIGKYQGAYNNKKSFRGKDEYYDLEAKEVIVDIDYPGGFLHWESGEPEPFQPVSPTVLELPASLNCRLIHSDGTVKYARLNIQKIKVLNYELTNQLYDGGYVYGDVSGDLSGYLLHHDTYQQTVTEIIPDDEPEVIDGLKPAVRTEGKQGNDQNIRTSEVKPGEGCFSTVFNFIITAVTVLFYLGLLFIIIMILIALGRGLLDKPAQPYAYSTTDSKNVRVQQTEQYREPTQSNPSVFIVPERDSVILEEAFTPLEIQDNDLSVVDTPSSSFSTVDSGGIDPDFDALLPGEIVIDRYATLDNNRRDSIDEYWITASWYNQNNELLKINYFLDAKVLDNTIIHRNRLSNSLGSFKNRYKLFLALSKQYDGEEGTTLIDAFGKMTSDQQFNRSEKIRSVISFFQSLPTVELSSGKCEENQEVTSSNDVGILQNRVCVDSVHLSIYGPLEVEMMLEGNSAAKTLACYKVLRALGVQVRILDARNSNSCRLAIQLDPGDERGRHEIWSLDTFSPPTIMYSISEIELEGWYFIPNP